MDISLSKVPGVDHEGQCWKVRCLKIGGKDPVNASLIEWSRKQRNDFRAIIKVMKMAATQGRIENPKHVKKSANPAHGDVYEIIAFTGVCRVMFFYDDDEERVIVCTNPYEKGASQDAAFGRCAQLKELYFKNKPIIHES
jgi:hypothetical protein